MDEIADELRQKEGCLPTEEQKRCDQIWNSDGLDASGDPIEKTPYDDFCDVVQKEVPEAEKLDPKGERQHMVAFIKQEACEKINEIEARTEEDFNLKKGVFVQKERLKLMQYYDREEKNAVVRRKRNEANLENAARLQVLHWRELIVFKVIEEARKHLNDITRNENPCYVKMLYLLIEEGIFLMQEQFVIVTAREIDHSLVHSLFNRAESSYKEATGNQVELILDQKHNLGPETQGGVYLRDRKNRIKVDNTLTTRFNIIVSKIMPEIRQALFGINKNRKHLD